MPVVAQCKHCRTILDTAGQSPGAMLMCGCGAMVFVVEGVAALVPKDASVVSIDQKSGMARTPENVAQDRSKPASLPACPRCKDKKLFARHAQGVLSYDCSTCKGVWLGGDAFEQICQKKQLEVVHAGAVLSDDGAARLKTPAPDHSAALACPVCRASMRRQVYAKVSGVQIDACKTHGVWLDKQELSLIVHFIESGGLQKPGAVVALKADVPEHAIPKPVKASSSGSDGWELAGNILGVVAVVADIFLDD